MDTLNIILYFLARVVARVGLFFCHPVFLVYGRKNIPEGRAVICSNHSGLADPVWLSIGLRQKRRFCIMAKESLLEMPVLKYLFRWLRMIGVRRGEGDVQAVKVAMRALKSGDKLLIFPEGTRIRNGARVEAKTGAVMLAARTDSPILPIFLTWKRRLWSPMRMIIGEPYRVGSERPNAEELRRLTDEMMDKIFALGERE